MASLWALRMGGWLSERFSLTSPYWDAAFSLLFSQHRVSCSPGWPQAPHVAKDKFEFLIFMSLSPKCWDYRYVSSSIVYVMLGIEPKASCLLKPTFHCPSYILRPNCNVTMLLKLLPRGDINNVYLFLLWSYVPIGSYGPNDKLRYVLESQWIYYADLQSHSEGSWAGAWTTLKQPQWKVYSQHRC